MSNAVPHEATPFTNWHLYIKAASGGVAGALLALIPVSILKTFGAFMRICFPLGIAEFSDTVSVWTCGITYDTTWSTIPAFRGYMLYVILGGALVALITMIVILLIREHFPPLRPGKKLHPFWWGFVTGMLFDLFFVFIYLYLGQ